MDSKDIDYTNSDVHRIAVEGNRKQCEINMKLYRVRYLNDTQKNYLYISERYVIPKLRGNKIGEQLLKIADDIASLNDCVSITTLLDPEYEENAELLEQGHKKLGYGTYRDSDGETIAIKYLNKLNTK
jgi:hypothetical protein